MLSNPWHAIPCGAEAPEFVNAIIEIPKGSKAKYELDKASGFLKLDRVLYSSVHYPANYGFIPHTYCDDHDPLDILVICSIPIEPMCLVEAKVIGVMRMQDNHETDDKIIAVARNDMSVSHIQEVNDLGPHIMLEIQRFFEDYKKLENKEVIVEEMKGREAAYQIIHDSIALYKQGFGDLQQA